MNFIYFFMALGLSMDAFSLATIYGTKSFNLKKVIISSLIVGLFHFIMPTLGLVIGNQLLSFLPKTNLLAGFIFLYLAIEMYKSRNEEISSFLQTTISYIIFALTVSFDSFSVGIAISTETSSFFLAFLIFSLTSAILTFLGFNIGHYISKKYATLATYLGTLILFLFSLKYFFNI